MNLLLAAMVNGAALGLALAAVVWLVLRVIPRSALNAATRYAIWWTVLAIVILLPALYVTRSQTKAVESAVNRPLPAVSAVSAPGTSRGATGAVTMHLAAAPVASAAPVPVRRAIAWPSFPVEIPAAVWPRVMVLGWLVLSALLVIRLVMSYLLLERASSRAQDVPEMPGSQVANWLALCGTSRQGVRLAASTELSTPVAAGPRHPAILIPVGLLEEFHAEELQQIGLHEAAHLARYDDHALLLQRTVEALLPLHPVVRWITRRIDLEREIACDDLVIAATGRPRSYARCLTRVVEFGAGARTSLAAAGAATETSHLSRRVDLLLDKTRSGGTRLLKARLSLMMVLVAALAWIAGQAPGLVAFASPLVAPVRQMLPNWFPKPMLARVAENPQDAPPDLEARVMEDSSGNPLASVEFRLRKTGMRELAADLDSDRLGHMRVSGLAPGEYLLEVAKPNFVTASLKVQLPLKGLVVRLVRYGSISGRVSNQEGQPSPSRIVAPGGRLIGGTWVHVLMKAAGGGAFRSVREVPLDEDGRYRIFDLTPGEYAVGTWYDGLKDGSGAQMYPDSAHPRFFSIAGGEEYNNIDFQIQPRPAYRVSGRIAVPKPGQQFYMTLGLPDQPAIPIAQTLSETDGSFHFEKVPSGNYDLFAGGPTNGYGARLMAVGADAQYAHTSVSVGGQNVDGLEIAVSAGRSLSVTLRAGTGQTPEGCPPTALVQPMAVEPWGLFPPRGEAATFGSDVTLRNLPPGRFRLDATGLPAGCYQVNAPVVDLSREISGAVPVELAAAGSIRGLLRSGPGRSKDFAIVLLAVDPAADAGSQLAYPDAEGRFSFAALRPGRYRIAAERIAEGSKSRWIGDVTRMVEIEVAGGPPTSIEIPAPAQEVGR